MSVLSILSEYQLKRRKRRKRVVRKNRCEIFRDNNHQSFYKNIKLYNDIDWNPRPVCVNESSEYCYLQGLLSHEKKNYCTPCVLMFKDEKKTLSSAHMKRRNTYQFQGGSETEYHEVESASTSLDLVKKFRSFLCNFTAVKIPMCLECNISDKYRN